jgi:hypothetical protein
LRRGVGFVLDRTEEEDAMLELGSWPEVGDDTRAKAVRGRRGSGTWARRVSERRAGVAYRFRTEASWAVGRIKGWAEMVPFGLF